MSGACACAEAATKLATAATVTKSQLRISPRGCHITAKLSMLPLPDCVIWQGSARSLRGLDPAARHNLRLAAFSCPMQASEQSEAASVAFLPDCRSYDAGASRDRG